MNNSNNTNNNNNKANREAESYPLIRNNNNKFHAQKYVTIPKINVFKKSENDLALPINIQKKLKPQSNSISQQSQQSQQSITENKRSYNPPNSPITSTSSKSLKEQRRRNNKDSRKPSRGVSTTSSTPAIKKSRLDQKQSTSLATVPPSPASPSSKSDDLIQQHLALPIKQRTIPRLPPTARSHCSDDSQHEKSPTHQSSVLETSSDSPNCLTKSQTPEQQLEIMKYWLEEYYKHNRFDPAISDLTSGKPWNEIEGKLLSQFMPVFKRYLSDNCVNTRTAEFYSLFFTALKDKHKISEIPYDD